MATDPRSISSSAPIIDATAGMITAYLVRPRSLRMCSVIAALADLGSHYSNPDLVLRAHMTSNDQGLGKVLSETNR